MNSWINMFPQNPIVFALSAIIQIFMINIALVSLYYIFPFIKRIIILLGFPLRTIHQFLHIFVWATIQPEKRYQLKSTNLKPQMELSLTLDQCSLFEILQIALSPLILGIPVAIMLPLVLPEQLITLEENLLYYYLLIIVSGVLWPDDEDYYVLYQALMLKIAISFKVYVILMISAIAGLLLGILLEQPVPTQLLFAVCSFVITLIYYSNKHRQPKIKYIDPEGTAYSNWNMQTQTQEKIISNKYIE